MDVMMKFRFKYEYSPEMTDKELLDDLDREMRKAFEGDLSYEVAQQFFRIRGKGGRK